MKTELASASVAQLIGDDSSVYIGADEDCGSAEQDGLTIENLVSIARSTRSQVDKKLVSCDQQATVARTLRFSWKNVLNQATSKKLDVGLKIVKTRV